MQTREEQDNYTEQRELKEICHLNTTLPVPSGQNPSLKIRMLKFQWFGWNLKWVGLQISVLNRQIPCLPRDWIPVLNIMITWMSKYLESWGPDCSWFSSFTCRALENEEENQSSYFGHYIVTLYAWASVLYCSWDYFLLLENSSNNGFAVKWCAIPHLPKQEKMKSSISKNGIPHPQP